MPTEILVYYSMAVFLLAGELPASPKALLADAVQQRNAAAASALLKEKTAINNPQPDGMTALHWAVHHDDVAMARALLDAGANAESATRYGVTPLTLACRNGNPELVKLLLTSGANPNATLAGGETALMTASRTGRAAVVEELLSHGADVDARERKGQTALMWAAAEGNTDTVNALLNAGADPSVRLPSGFTAFFFAVREGRIAAMERLLAAGINPNEPLQPEPGRSPGKKMTALLLAVENGHFELAEKLLAAGADPNAAPAGYTALHAITWVRKPIRGDGDPPPRGSGRLSSFDCVRRLMAYGANVNARLEKGESGRGKFTAAGSTPFLLAARASDSALMKLLVEFGADVKQTNADGCTPLLAACGVGALGDGDEAAGTEAEALEAVALLVKLGADVNAVDKNGETAMHGAAYQDRPNIVRYLADNGAKIAIWNRENKWGWTPMSIAAGHRPGNFRPEPDTIAALSAVMLASGIRPANTKSAAPAGKDY